MLLLTASALSTVVPPQAWLSDALCSMVEHLTSRLDVLLPWNWKTRLSGTCLAGGARVRIPFAPAVSQCRGGHRECKRQEREVPQRREFLRAQPAGGVRDELAHRGDRGQARRRARGLKRRWVGVGEISDGHRWDSPPKIRFAPDSPLEGRGFEPLVPLPSSSLDFSGRRRRKSIRMGCYGLTGTPLRQARCSPRATAAL